MHHQIKNRKSVVISQQNNHNFKQIRMNIFGEQDFYKYRVIKFIFIIFILMIMISLMYLINIIIQTINLHNDNYKTIIQKNDFNQINELYLFRDFNFLPIISFDGHLSGEGSNLTNQDTLISSVLKVDYHNGKQYTYPDYNRFRKYVKIVLNMNVNKDGQDHNYQVEFRQCNHNDLNNLIDKVQNIRINPKQFICPDIEKTKEIFRIKNGYIGFDERYSFSIQMIVDNQDSEHITKVKQLLNGFIFTNFILQEIMDFSNPDNLMKRPITQELKFIQQYQLSMDSYRDNNNFIRLNQVKTQDNRFDLLNIYSYYQYLDLVPYPVWYGNQLNKSINVTFDNGKTYQNYKYQILSGNYFFMSNDIVIHERNVFSYMSLVSQVGGLVGFMFGILGIMTKKVAYSFTIGYLIRQFYWQDQNNKIYSLERDKDMKIIGMKDLDGDQLNITSKQSNPTDKIKRRHGIIETIKKRIKKRLYKTVIYSQNEKEQFRPIKFTFLDQLGGILGFNILQKMLNKTRFIQNIGFFDKFKQKIEKELNLTNMLIKFKKVDEMETELKDLQKIVNQIKQNQSCLSSLDQVQTVNQSNQQNIQLITNISENSHNNLNVLDNNIYLQSLINYDSNRQSVNSFSQISSNLQLNEKIELSKNDSANDKMDIYRSPLKTSINIDKNLIQGLKLESDRDSNEQQNNNIMNQIWTLNKQ